MRVVGGLGALLVCLLREEGHDGYRRCPHRTRVPASALLLIDTQVDFVDGGSSPITGTTQVLPAMADVLQTFRAAHRPIVHIVRLYDGTDIDLVRRTLTANKPNIVVPGWFPNSRYLARPPARRSQPSRWRMGRPRSR
jgi:hypothetical protein